MISMMRRIRAMGKRSLNFFTAQLSSKNRHITVDGKTIVKLFYPRGRHAPASVGLKHDGLMWRGKLKVNAHLLWRRVYSLYYKKIGEKSLKTGATRRVHASCGTQAARVPQFNVVG